MVGKVLIHKDDEYKIMITNGHKKYYTDISESDFERLKIGDFYQLKD
jgi:hypothetical protein